jgi:DNA-binding transcriptional ArsR family regulator
MIKPRLRMGLVGFPREEYLHALLRTRSAVLTWEHASAADADALWVNGEAARFLYDDLVSVAPGATAPAMTLDLQALDRPTFFTLPLADERIRVPLVLDLHSAPSVDKALRRAQSVLHPLVMQLALGHEIAERLPGLTGTTYHVTQRGRLVAVVNMGGAIGIDLNMLPPHLEGAEWRPLPRAAGSVPPQFFTTSFAEVLWNYVNRVDADLLPDRYRRATIFFRAIPRVPQRLMKESHYAVLSELGAEPHSFRQLQQNVGLAEGSLAKTLAVLYYAGAVTTNPQRAAKGATRHVREAESESELRQSLFPQEDSQPFSAFQGRASEERPTLPAALEPEIRR